MIRKLVLAGAAALACVLWVPTAAQAQSAIAGVVKDTSGAVLPGVTVEAASPALIEKTRAVTTDGEGRYNIVDLRPGVYSITFSLEGFSTVKRDGVELPAGFTATINGDMKVGSLEETITVSTWDFALELTSTTGDAPDTVTDSSSAPTFISPLIVAVKPAGSSTPSRLTVLKPSSEKVTL